MPIQHECEVPWISILTCLVEPNMMMMIQRHGKTYHHFFFSITALYDSPLRHSLCDADSFADFLQI